MSVALVTGGAGFLGAALVRRLVAAGRGVRVVDDASRGSFTRLADLDGRYEPFPGDVRDAALVRRAAEGCDALFHLAAVNGTKNFYEQPERVLDVAIRGTLAAVTAAREAGVRRFLLASSGEVYHEPPVVPTPEEVRLLIPDPYNPRFSYAGGKIASELIAINYLRSGATGCIIFRPHNIYGPAMGFEHVIPNLVQKVKAAAQHAGGAAARGAGLSGDEVVRRAVGLPDPLPVVEIELQGSGQETRAFCFVEDAAAAIALLEERGAPGRTYHVGREEETAISDLARRLGRVVGLDVRTRPGVLPEGAPQRRCADTSRLRALGFSAATSLEQGLAKTVPFYWDHEEPPAAGGAKAPARPTGARP